jgi:hypothetical protein
VTTERGVRFSMAIPNRAPWITLALAILIIISPFVAVPNSTFARWDIDITGAVIGAIAIVQLTSFATSVRVNYWHVVNILAGIWLFISTTWLSGNLAMIWSNIVLGTLTIVTALVAISYERLDQSREMHR